MNIEIPSAASIRWQCRRGMLELDLLLLTFLDKCYETLSLGEQRAFVELLALSDQQLYGWLIGRDEVEPNFQSLVKQIRKKLWEE